jgi:hypothetical protein
MKRVDKAVMFKVIFAALDVWTSEHIAWSSVVATPSTFETLVVGVGGLSKYAGHELHQLKNLAQPVKGGHKTSSSLAP